jgi:hypothetical protein
MSNLSPECVSKLTSIAAIALPAKIHRTESRLRLPVEPTNMGNRMDASPFRCARLETFKSSLS